MKTYKCNKINCSQCDFSPGDFNCRVHADEITIPNKPLPMSKSIVCNEPSCELFSDGLTDDCMKCNSRVWYPENAGDKNAEGTKYDKGKARVGEMIIDFLRPILLVCKVWEFGANKYSKSNWKKVDNGGDRYTNAMTRHLLLEDTEVFDPETKLHHAIHVAWNALARLYFIIKEDSVDEKEREVSGSIHTDRKDI